jgi:hypothetical protein
MHDSASNQLNDEAIYRRGQFYLGQKKLKQFPNWSHYLINGGTYLSTHPSVNVETKIIGKMHATLIGFIIDPNYTDASNEEIITKLLTELNHEQPLFPLTYNFCGRYILIIGGDGDTIIFTDATGNRQIFYTDIKATKHLWCASEPGILSEICNLNPDPVAQSFMDSPEFKDNDEFWWPGDTSVYCEVRRLLPNHYLNLNNGKCIRYWPDKHLISKSSKHVAKSVASTMKSLLKGANNRAYLSVSITSGLDSRIVLAASKQVASNMSFMTVQQKNMSIDHADVTLPKRILSDLALPYSIIKSDKPVRENFKYFYYKSILHVHEKWLGDAQCIFDYNNAEKIAVTGSVAEVARLFYNNKSLKNLEEITPDYLSSITKMGNHPFVIAAFERWLDGLDKTYNYEIADLLYWEQRAGSWLAASQSEFSLVWGDIFTPFNCRAMLIEMLSVDRRLRKPPDSIFFKDVIRILWPKLLKYPINPHQTPSRRKRLKQIARKIALRLIAN